MKNRCPICNKPIKTPSGEQSEQAGFFPFCSQRCKLIDLGAWLDAEYRINSKIPDASCGDQPDSQ